MMPYQAEDEMIVFAAEETPSTTTPSIVFGTFDQALKVVGSFGRYQITYILVLQLVVLIFCGNFVFMPYATYEPKVTCYFNDTYRKLNFSDSDEFCQIYKNELCENVSWESPFHTIIEEWKLICDKNYVGELINTITVIGSFLAAVIGYFSDVFGRKTLFLGTFSTLIFVSISSTWMTTWWSFAMMRFCVGFLLSASSSIIHVWGMEITDQKYNFIINLASLWQFAYMFTALLGYLTGGWKIYLITLNAIGAPTLIAFCCCFVESPRWLVQTGKIDKAAKLLNKISNQNRPINRVQLSSDHLSGIPQHEFDVKHSKLNLCSLTMILFSNKVLRKYVLTLALVVFAGATIVSAFIFQVSFLPGNPFIKFFFYGLFRMITPLVLYFANNRVSWFGRRHIICLTFIAVLALYGISTIIRWCSPDSTFVFIFFIAGAITCNFLWTGISQYSVELFPTHLRNTATCGISMIDPFAVAAVPQLVYRGQKWHWPSLPLMWAELWTIIALVIGYWVLPETKGRPLPDTIETVEKLSEEHSRNRSFRESWLFVKSICRKKKESYENMENTVHDAFVMDKSDGEFYSVPI